jgi:hypothetical protein
MNEIENSRTAARFWSKKQEILRSEDRMIFKRQKSPAVIIPQTFQANERE